MLGRECGCELFYGVRSYIRMSDVSTWPKVPINGILREGIPTKTKARNKGEKVIYDQYDRQWRPHLKEKHHYTLGL